MSASPTSRGWGELALNTGKRTMEHDGLGLAAQLGFYFFLAVFPAMLFLLALASFFPLQQFTQSLMGALEGVAPPEMVALIGDQMEQISERRDVGLLSIGLLGALWSSSAALAAVISALNRVYATHESRPFWKSRLVAIGLTIGLAFFVLVAFTLVVAGPQIAQALANQAGLGGAFTMAWNILQWPVAFGLVVLGIGLVYYFAPNVEQRWTDVVSGAILATVLWLVATLAFRYYVTNFGNYQEMYGAIGGVILLMLWFYISGLALLVGAELNAQLRGVPAETEGAAPAQESGAGVRADRPADRRAWVASQPALPARGAPILMASMERQRPPFMERLAGMVIWLIWPRARTRS